MNELKVGSVHSVFYRNSSDESVALHFYENVDMLVIMQLISCSKKITGLEKIETDFSSIIDNDGVFGKLCEKNRNALCKMLVEHYYSIEQDDTDDLSTAISFLRYSNTFAMIAIKNEITSLANNTFGKPCLEFYEDDNPECTDYISVKNITYYGPDYENFEGSALDSYSSYVTYPNKSVPIDKEVVHDCLLKCYVKKIISVTALLNNVDIYAYLHEIEESKLRTAVISELIDIAVKNAGRFHSEQLLFKDYYKLLLHVGGLINGSIN